MAEHRINVPLNAPDPLIGQLDLAFSSVGECTAGVRPEQWLAPTPCAEWTVRQLIDHLVGMNRVFTAMFNDAPPPGRSPADTLTDQVNAYFESATALQDAFSQPGVLDRQYAGPLGTVSGAERLQIRLYDLIAHGWDLAQATDQLLAVPDDLVEQSLAFARVQLAGQRREGRFAAPQSVREDAPAIERLVAFLGRTIPGPP
jgi:uncharacterized protein (TIGR03086 family)